MRILIDLQGAQNNSRFRGIGRYSLELARGIARNANSHQILIFLSALFPESIDPIRSDFLDLIPEDNIVIFQSPSPVSALAVENTWRRCAAELIREYMIENILPDVLLIMSTVEGAVDDTVTSIRRLDSTVSTAAIMYDLIPLIESDRYLTSDPEKKWYQDKIDSLRQADCLLAISQATVTDAIEMLQLPPNRILNISAAVSHHFSLPASATAAQSTCQKYGITRPYLMHSSAFDRRKNFQGLMRAYAAIPLHTRRRFQLVLVCKLDSAGRQELSSLAGELGISQNDLVLTGFVPDSELAALYSACHLFVFPSLSEGFGLPALEAMSCGAPTIGSDIPSVAEVIDRQDSLFDATSVEAITAAIVKALTEQDYYLSIKGHAKRQASKFSWDLCARRALERMERLFTSRGRSRPQANGRRRFMEALGLILGKQKISDLDLLEFARIICRNEDAVYTLNAAQDRHSI